ncbi:MAG: hypothetical protein ABSC08_10200 [Bryobacteraceae bacterium]|jgi:hypothetical protein
MRIAHLLLAFTLSVSAFAAAITGKWNLTAKDPDGTEIKADLVIKSEDGKLSGTIGSSEGTTPLTDVEFKDNVFTCRLTYNDNLVTLKLTLDGDTLKGNWSTDDGATGPVEATRQTETKTAKLDSPVAGVWKIDTVGPDGNPLKAQLTLKQDNGAWGGQLVVEEYGMTIPLEDVKVQGADVSLKVPTDSGTYAIEGKVSGERFEGTAIAPDGSKNKFSGTR